jgi:tetratricopeptide (TPR) repeat protein
MKKLVPVMLATVLFASNGVAAQKGVATDPAHPMEIGFSHVFEKKLYEKKYFGIAVLGTTVVAAGALSYFTAGAGAPTAATGVSTVASWVGGGGAGSYMAGLSTIGSAFGGNAMVGAAILNGVSIATVGGGSTFASLSAAQKALAMASVSATMLDGVAVLNGTDTKALNYRIALPTPRNIGSKDLREQAEKLRKLGEDEWKLGKKLDDLVEDRKKTKEAGKDPDKGNSAKKLSEAESKLSGTREMRVKLENDIASRARDANANNCSSEDIVLLAVLAKNLGKSGLFADLIRKVPTENSKDAGYVNYLKAVAKIERNEVDAARKLLEQSSIHNPYAIEPPILRVNILGSKGFDANKGEIIDIVSRTEKLFDNEKYATPFSLVSLYYRVGTLALISKDYPLAETYFNKALDMRSLWEKYGLKDGFDSMIKTGLANAVYGQGRKDEALTIVDKQLKKAKDGHAREVVCAQFMGRCV